MHEEFIADDFATWFEDERGEPVDPGEVNLAGAFIAEPWAGFATGLGADAAAPGIALEGPFGTGDADTRTRVYARPAADGTAVLLLHPNKLAVTDALRAIRSDAGPWTPGPDGERYLDIDAFTGDPMQIGGSPDPAVGGVLLKPGRVFIGGQPRDRELARGLRDWQTAIAEGGFAPDGCPVIRPGAAH